MMGWIYDDGIEGWRTTGKDFEAQIYEEFPGRFAWWLIVNFEGHVRQVFSASASRTAAEIAVERALQGVYDRLEAADLSDLMGTEAQLPNHVKRREVNS
jgi:hypothetical protein